MKMTGVVVMLVAIIVGSASAETLSEPALIRLFPNHNRCWETVYSNEVSLRWGWDWFSRTAVSVELRIDGMNGDTVTNMVAPTTNWAWHPFEGESPSSEDVYLLTLTYYDSGNIALGSVTSRLAVVKGAFSQASVDLLPASTEWSRVRDNAVIPYSADWAPETAAALSGRLTIAKVGGLVRMTEMMTPNGYFGWQIKPSDWGTGMFDLNLVFPQVASNVWQATLTRFMEGTVLLVQ